MDTRGREGDGNKPLSSGAMAPEDFERLVAEHITLLTAVATRLLRDVTQAESLVQTVLAEVLQQQNTLTATGSIKGQLLTTLRKTFIEQYDKRKRRLAFS